MASGWHLYSLYCFVSSHIPQLNSLVHTATGNNRWVRWNIEASNLIIMAFKGSNTIFHSIVPDLNIGVQRTWDQIFEIFNHCWTVWKMPRELSTHYRIKFVCSVTFFLLCVPECYGTSQGSAINSVTCQVHAQRWDFATELLTFLKYY